MAGTAAIGSGPASAAKTASPLCQQDIVRTVAAAPLLPQRKGLSSDQEERVDGVRQDLDVAVWLGQVTQDQADRFAAQIEDRVAKGL